MAHMFESGFFHKQGAWHGLGNVVQGALSTGEAIAAAGLDWNVEECPLLIPGEHGPVEVPEHKALLRSTDRRVLGVVGKAYVPLQNRQAFAFFDGFVQSGEATLESAGALKHGRRVWILARINTPPAEIVPGDRVETFLLLSNAHDGSLAIGVNYTPIRVVCNNTLSMALGKAEAARAIIRIKHTAHSREALEIVRESVELAARSFAFTVTQYRKLARADMGVSGFERYVRQVFDIPEIETELPRAWDELLERFEVGRGVEVPGVRGTAWGAYNAVTEWVQHVRGRNAESRLDAAWFGEGRRIRDKALEGAVASVS
jgi:phage/plasmid-like protein (TIGR03299 family)